jgi:ATP-dependent DNA helicase RecQ
MVAIATDILLKYWRYAAFRPGQESVVAHILTGQDTISLLPTGGGKSICFQVPGMMHEGLTLVICPLISLIKDQVDGLQRRNIEAVGLHSGLTHKETRHIMDKALRGDYRFLYISPERLATENFREYLPNLNIKLLVVDEAHCISQWGYEFRPAYLRIAECRQFLPDVPIAAFTASAPPYVVKDIADKLGLNEPRITMGDFGRPNLHFHVMEQEDKYGFVLKMLSNTLGSSLVFARNRRETEELSVFLQQHGLSADYYHAGLKGEDRARKQDLWMKNQLRVMCCTNAFGMGVDKPDVRFVFHLTPPPSPEDYYQEAGRAGRDGKDSWCIMLYRQADFEQLKVQVDARFPNAEVLARVYKALMAYLDIPEGGGMHQWYELDPAEVAGRYRFQLSEFIHGLKSLEMLQFFTLSEGIHTPSAIHISADYASVYDFKIRNPEYEPLIDMLLRSHAGILDNYMTVYESVFCKRLRMKEGELREKLKWLQSRQILDYRPASEKPRVFLYDPRHSRPVFNVKNLEPLKKARLHAIEHMQQYVAGRDCRAMWWISYFTSRNTTPCGHCDLCSRRKKSNDGATVNWTEKIKQLTAGGIHDVDSLLDQLPGEEAVKQLRLLMDEGIIAINSEGKLVWVSP